MVLVPAELCKTHSDDEIRGILLHELAHVRRSDVLWSWLGLTACALHWFNPLAWLTLRRYHADRELECDRMALENMNAPQRQAYAPALFKALQAPALATSVALAPFFRHKAEIHTRILSIMKPTKSVVASLVAVLLIPGLSLLSLTKASADGEKVPGAEGGTKGDGGVKKDGPRDGEVKKEGARDGETKKTGPRDGEVKKEGIRDGENKKLKEGAADGAVKKEGARDGEVKKVKEGAADGAVKKEGARDGEVKKAGAKDGEVKKEGARDGETKKTGVKDGESGKKVGASDGDSPKKVKEGASDAKAAVIRVLGAGENVSVNGETVPTNGLRGYLNEHPIGSAVLIEAEDSVPYGAVMDVLDAARDSGAKNAKVAVRQGAGEKEKVSKTTKKFGEG